MSVENATQEQRDAAMRLWCLLRDNDDIRSLTFTGLLRGEVRGKSMNFDSPTLRASLMKQIGDWTGEFDNHSQQGELKALADIMNNAGLLILKITGVL